MKLKSLALILAMTAPAIAQATKNPIDIECNNAQGDTVGASICTAMRDRFARSPRYYLSTITESPNYLWTVHINSVSGIDGVTSAMSYAVTLNGSHKGEKLELYSTSGIQFCGANKIDSCAVELVSAIDGNIWNMLH